MNRILALWATPRSTSTAFEWAMGNRGDMTCFHEPYNEAFHYGEDRRNHRYFIADPALQATPGLTITSVYRKLTALARSERVFVKDFAYSILHMANDEFLHAHTHTFLIRDPRKMLTSMHSRWPDITLAEIGFEDLHTLFRRVVDREGGAPVVLDSDELLENPANGMQAYCAAVGIPFIAEALSWENGQDESRNPTWNSDEHGFHDSLKANKGLAKQQRNYPTLASPDMIRLFEASKPHYDALFSQRLRID
ncbi:MAG: sulfotransferase family protein [Gammaproteobacteria bacterium]|nr:sulfotransferase family protein [Gammaproteobacteria bacterium]